MVKQFQKNVYSLEGSVYTCRICKKRTRETGHDESSVQLCKACLLEAQDENERLNK
tara:strand:- start:992 stop:1159 length:168 start_codon:yes stop_codon:yes gene_type:complete